jgi:hypothetical protein
MVEAIAHKVDQGKDTPRGDYASRMGGGDMFVSGLITGAIVASILCLAVLCAMHIKFEDELWVAQSKALVRDKAFQAIFEDHRGRRRAAECVKTVDEIDELEN